ncbi:MAG: BON domain-containing protein [Burkholderiales bacterium]|jgi:osmotically-inducible protein OsmY
MKPRFRVLCALTLLSVSVAISGCVSLSSEGVQFERRTLGVQTDDTQIEWRVSNRMPDAIRGSRGVSVTSYNKRVLLTGQVPDAQAKAEAGRLAQQVFGVAEVYNELEIGPRLSLTAQAADSALTARVKAAFVEQQALSHNTVKVITENNVVYLMGLVTRREAPAYSTVASRVGGVRRVVTLFEYITDEELQRIRAR